MKQFLYILLIGCGFLFGTACSNDDSDDVLEKVQNAIDATDADDEPTQPETSTRSYKNIVTLQLKTSGTLKALLGDSLTTADKLILSGPIDADDVSTFLNDMPALVGLDLTNTTMVESEKTFYNKAYSSTKRSLKEDAIVEYMFWGQKFVEIKLPQGITSIEKNAFRSSKALTSIEIPQKVEVINESAFEQCEALSTITFPDSLTTIGKSVFYYCI